MRIEKITMPDDVELPFSESPLPHAPAAAATPDDKKTRGRPKSIISETTKQRLERAKAEFEKASQAHKAAELNLASLIGSVVVNHARADENYRQNLATLLRDKLKSKADLAAVAEFLV